MRGTIQKACSVRRDVANRVEVDRLRERPRQLTQSPADQQQAEHRDAEHDGDAPHRRFAAEARVAERIS